MTESTMHTESSDYSIVVEGLTKTYGNFRALNAINFQVKPGEIVGFLGPNGAGKTTTMKILTCFMAATQGTARVAGFDVHEQSELVRQKIGYLPENVPLYENMLVYDYLMFIAQIRNVPANKRRERLTEVAKLTGLEKVISKTIDELSKGYRQRVGLAQAIIHEPDVIILDEPTTGLDPNQIIEIRDVIKTIGQEKTIIFSTHILQEVTAVCDRIIIINEGQIVADGTLRELEQKVSATQPGMLVSFDASQASTKAVTDMLRQLPGVDAVSSRPSSDKELTFSLRTKNHARTRQALIENEAQKPMGMMSLRNAEPTLEDIFRLYTGGATQESVNEASSTPPPASSNGIHTPDNIKDVAPDGPDELPNVNSVEDTKNIEKKEVTHA